MAIAQHFKMFPQGSKIQLLPTTKDTLVLWIDNQQKTQPILRPDQEFKRQHLSYIQQRMRRKQEEKRFIKEQYGETSSDQDEKNKMNKNTSNVINNSVELDKGQQPIVVLPPKFARTLTPNSSSPSPRKYKLSTSSHSSVDVFDLQPSAQLKNSTNLKNPSPVSNQDSIKIWLQLKNRDQWIQSTLQLTQNKLTLAGKDIAIYDISKIKLIFTEVATSCYKIKITHNKEDFIFAVSYNNIQKQLPDCLYVFASIINRKLALMGFKIGPPLPVPEEMVQQIGKQSTMCGYLSRKAKVINKWSQGKGAITQQGLFFMKIGQEKGSLMVRKGSVSEIWTRFQSQQGKLVVKMFQDSSKLQLGVGIQDFTQVQGWLSQLYGLKGSNSKK